MEDELHNQIAKTRRDRPLRVALHGPESPVLRATMWVFVFASACHLWLADAWQVDWLLADVIYVAGLALLCWRGAAIGWLLCAVGAAIPLFFHRDILTQSFLLLVFSSTTGVSLIVDGLRMTAHGPRAGSPGSEANTPQHGAPQHGARHHDEPHSMRVIAGEHVTLAVFRGVTILTYALAAFHKLNEQFFDPQFSCAVYGLDELFDYWNLGFFDALPPWALAAAPWLVFAGEAGIALLHLARRSRLAWTLTIAFHIPLTLTMAPAFVFVMLTGHAAFATVDDLRRLRAVVTRFGPAIGVLAAALTGASLAAHKNLPEWTMIPREWLLWALLMALILAFPPWRAETWRAQRPAPQQHLLMSARLAVGAVLAVVLLNGLTPYLGVQYQHAGAMVSNLRIDKGCWNSLVVPESVRLTDDYIRVDEVYFGQPGQVPDYEGVVLEQLWSPPQVRQMRRNWCRPKARPFYLRGTFRGREFAIEDVCAEEPLPFRDAGIFGVEIFGDFLRFQKNLVRECPQTCIH